MLASQILGARTPDQVFSPASMKFGALNTFYQHLVLSLSSLFRQKKVKILLKFRCTFFQFYLILTNFCIGLIMRLCSCCSSLKHLLAARFINAAVTVR